jgi:hypothetical protein
VSTVIYILSAGAPPPSGFFGMRWSCTHLLVTMFLKKSTREISIEISIKIIYKLVETILTAGAKKVYTINKLNF